MDHNYANFVESIFRKGTWSERMLHGVVGVCGEAGELADGIKKAVYYEKPIDHDNVVEEIGDILFYCQAVLNELSSGTLTLQDCVDANVKKLKKRYPEGSFSTKQAIERADKI